MMAFGNNVQNAGVFLVNILISLYAFTFMARFLLQLVRANFYNPISQVLIKVTNPVLKPVRRLVPGFRGMDIAALVVVLLLEVIKVCVIYGLMLGLKLTVLSVVLVSLQQVVLLAIWIYFWSILMQALMSWINPGTYNPVVSVLHSLNEPLLRPVRRVLPAMSGIDFSPLVVMLGLQVLRILIS